MQKISQQTISDNHNLIKTEKDTAIFEAVSFTGLPENHIKLLYESDNLMGFTGSLKNNMSNNFNISQEILKVLNNNTLESDKLKELNRLADNVKNYVNLDSIDLLNGISDLLVINDPKAKDFILGENKLKEFEDTNLNESEKSYFVKINFDNNIKESKQLFESLKELLHRQGSRWGNNYRLTNTYNGIIYYLDNEIQRLMLMNDIVTSDTNFINGVIKSFLNEESNPIYRDYSNFKNISTDVQTLVFDLMLLVNYFVLNNREALDFIAKSTLHNYQNSSDVLITNISSSVFSSKILKEEIKEKFNEIFAEEKDKYEQNLSLIYILTNNIEFTKFNQYSGSFNFVSTKAAHDMLLLINSTSSEFNLRLRPMIKNYFTKAYELVKRVDEAQFRLNRFRYGK